MGNEARTAAEGLQRNADVALKMAESAIARRGSEKKFVEEWSRFIWSKLQLLASDIRLPESSRARLRAHTERWRLFTDQWARANYDELAQTLIFLKAEKTNLRSVLSEISEAE
jgi:hypothetical protein